MFALLLPFLLPLTAAALECKAYPNTSIWPSRSLWTRLNTTVNGALEEVIPPGAVCHNTYNGIKTYNLEGCLSFFEDFTNHEWYLKNPVAVMSDFWSNQTCGPTLVPSQACTNGNYPSYVIKAKSVADVQAGVNFARENNVRLVIKNTGHDFMGRSIGSGALSIWTHQFNEIELLDFEDPITGMTTPALRVGSGVTTLEAYQYADRVSKTIVGGAFESVGWAGGYMQAGGISQLSTTHGFAAESALQFEVVTADGKHVLANAAENPDLYWALRGGGAGNWGVVTAVTVKAHPAVTVEWIYLMIPYIQVEPLKEQYWDAMLAWHKLAPSLADNGIYSYFEVKANEFGAMITRQPSMGASVTNKTITQVITPFLDELTLKQTPYMVLANTTFTKFYDAFEMTRGRIVNGGRQDYLSSRLITRQNIAENVTGVVKAIREANKAGYHMEIRIVEPSRKGISSGLSINPTWKKGLVFAIYYKNFNPSPPNEAQKWAMIEETKKIDGYFKAASPGSCAYSNEGNAYEANWIEDFWGSNYPRLLEVKKQYDPKGVFYAKTGVGSEAWDVVNGRLCKL